MKSTQIFLLIALELDMVKHFLENDPFWSLLPWVFNKGTQCFSVRTPNFQVKVVWIPHSNPARLRGYRDVKIKWIGPRPKDKRFEQYARIIELSNRGGDENETMSRVLV